MYNESCIIQIEEEPIESENMFDTNELICGDEYEWFFSSVACNGVDEDNQFPEDTLEDFIEYLKSFGNYVEVSDDKKWVVFKEGFVQTYFERIYPEFQETLKMLTDNISHDAFVNNDYKIWSSVLWLDKILNGTYGAYVKTGRATILTLNRFIRDYLEQNKRYYIGGAVDYTD